MTLDLAVAEFIEGVGALPHTKDGIFIDFL